MWGPIADPATARRCWSAIEEIERALAEHMETDEDPMLASGQPGQALFFAYLDAARKGSDAADRALDALGRSIDALAERQLLPTLYSGISGIGWAVEHLTRRFFATDEDLCGDIDEALEKLLSKPTHQYELINGLAGYGTYLLERLPNPDAARLLVRVIDLLEESAEGSWHTRPEWLPSWQRELMPAGCHNLGVAHGVPGVLGFLAAARLAGVDDPRVPRLAEGVVRWLLGRKLPPGAGSVFPATIVPGMDPEPTRIAWCYGDLGIAVVLLAAARSFGRPDWEEEALSLARRLARRPVEAVDSSLCHGTAGNGHLFNRLYQATDDPEIRESALAWYRLALDQRRQGEGFAGFVTWIGPGPGAGEWAGHPGMLIGAAGVGLALLAAVSDVEPAWDRLLLASIPPLD
jgi:lantibiotic modifying enzyme